MAAPRPAAAARPRRRAERGARVRVGPGSARPRAQPPREHPAMRAIEIDERAVACRASATRR